jgi:hypothetical protein
MKIEELNTGRKIEYELRGTKLDFADSTLVMNLAKYQKEDTVTATITANAQGNLAVDSDNGLYYVAQVEIPGYEYEEVEVEGPAQSDAMAAAVEETDPQTDAAQTEKTATITHIERRVLPLDTEKVILRLWSIEDFESIL